MAESGYSTEYEKKILEMIVGREPEEERIIHLCKTAPTKSAEGERAKYTGYAGIKTTHSSWGAAEAGDPESTNPSKIKNSEAIKFPENTGSSEELDYFEMITVSGEHRVAWGKLLEKKTIGEGTIPEVPVGDLEITQT